MRGLTGALGIAVACAGVLFAWTVATAAGAAPYPAFYPADAVRGKTLSAACVACHGPHGTSVGAPPFHVPKLGGQRPSSIFDALLEYKSGARRSDIMTPLAAAMSERDMRDVAMYLAGAPIEPSREPVAASWAHTRVHDDCAACHGETGLGVMPGYPVLGGQYADYLAHALRAFQNGERTNPTMVAMARGLTDDQIRQLAGYFADRNYLRTTP